MEKLFNKKIKSLQQSFVSKLSDMTTTLEDETNGAYHTITLECSKLQTQIDLIKDELLEIDTASLKTEHNLIQSQINYN